MTKPTGIETLNGAIEKVYAKVPPEKWVFVSMAVAPSTITICEHSVSLEINEITEITQITEITTVVICHNECCDCNVTSSDEGVL